jgi:hypothetical protein
MSIIPASNGIDNIVPGYGINIVDVGFNTFSIGLSLVETFALTDVAIPSPPPLGTTVIVPPGIPIVFPVDTMCMLTAYYRTTTAVTAAGQDRIIVQFFKELNPSVSVGSIYLMPYQDPVAATQVQTITTSMNLSAGQPYNFRVTILNSSNNFDLGAGAIVGMYIVPLTSSVANTVAPAPAPPAAFPPGPVPGPLPMQG